ncbi:MAG: hypothetical protein WCR47_07500 [Desulfoplanes sp.]|jgi:DnaJ-class molecular chaperone
MFENARKTLRVGPNATHNEVRKAYIKMVRRYPPEHFPEKFLAIKKAQETLNMEENAAIKWLVATQGIDSPRKFFQLWFQDDFEGQTSVLDEIPQQLDMQPFTHVLSGGEMKEALEQAVSDIAAQGIEMRR